MENINNLVPERDIIYQRYELYKPYLHKILSLIEVKLKDTLQLSSNPTFKSRVKSFESYYKKILRKQPDAAIKKNLVQLTDMMGIRVICAFMEDLSEVERQLMANFDVKEVERKGAEQSFREFGYESVHILIKIPSDCIPKEHKTPELPSDIVCEIQIRTILQDAWAEVEHELIYKSEFNPFDKPLRRKLASINASLSLADTIFQEIRDYQNRLQSELGCRRNTFYDKADEITEKDLGSENINVSSPMQKASEMPSPYIKGSIDDLVLQALHEHNTGNFAQAISIYTRILNLDPVPNNVVQAVIYKHRGMAYFAQNEYAKALQDFKKSEECDKNSFRSIYYEGIVYSILNDDRAAIECFTRSLSVDSYQSHVYYRRALSYFNLGDYKDAMQDITATINLGLNDDDVQNLKAKLMQKFDMKV